ncbi:winged helix DNA-binding domain-containing protein [Actinoplanes sp. URMC 104]|uniref:winged helix DNA-binding domain-containing protein n=1 Tax=Actinoplanes sp. URMC 104 TaxID=3423409 RepID=UPI003F1BBE0D
MRHVSNEERRARLAVRHALAGKAESPEAATRAMTVLHSTEPATVYLSCWARVPSLSAADVDRALYADRTLVKQLAMRRTLFVFPRELLPFVWPSASARSAAMERAAITKDAVKAGLAADGHEWLDRARAAVLDVLADAPEGLLAADLRRAVPMIDVKVAVTPGVSWSAGRVLTHLGLTGDVVRGTNTQGWHVSRPRWTLMRHWLSPVPAPLSADEGYRELVRRWLFTFGPGTEDDLVWWLGSTKAVVRAALTALAAEPVTLDGGATGWLLPDDLGVVPWPEPWAALLPVLDPTVMGWRGRDFYLGPHRSLLFDRNGNAGTTAWFNGRAVGCWTQDAAGVVRVRLLEDVPADGRRLLDAEAARLTAWLDGHRVGSVYSSPAMKP